MPRKGVKLYLARRWMGIEEERNKERSGERVAEGKKLRALSKFWESEGWGSGSGWNPATRAGDRMSEKERNRASQLQNKCELISPRETFYITSALPCLNVLQRLRCAYVCVLMCVFPWFRKGHSHCQRPQSICVCFYERTHICKPFLKVLQTVYIFAIMRVCIYSNAHAETSFARLTV